MKKLEIIVNEMMAVVVPVPMSLGNVGVHDTKTTQSDSDTSNDMSHEDVCAIAWKGYKAGKGAGKKGSNGSGTWHRAKGADERTSGGREDGAKERRQKGLHGQQTRLARRQVQGRQWEQRERQGAKARARVKPDIAMTAESKGTSE